MHSEIVAVAKEGTRVKILLESGRWLQVRSEEGVEAWIYKPLVLIEQEPIQSPSETPVAVAPSDLTETASAAATTPDILVESPPQNTLEGPGVRRFFSRSYQGVARPTPNDMDGLG